MPSEEKPGQRLVAVDMRNGFTYIGMTTTHDMDLLSIELTDYFVINTSYLTGSERNFEYHARKIYEDTIKNREQSTSYGIGNVHSSRVTLQHITALHDLDFSTAELVQRFNELRKRISV